MDHGQKKKFVLLAEYEFLILGLDLNQRVGPAADFTRWRAKRPLVPGTLEIEKVRTPYGIRTFGRSVIIGLGKIQSYQ
mgnify:CR=1 FL=1